MNKDGTTKTNVTYRRVLGPAHDGLFVNVNVCNVNNNALIDTGSTLSVIHPSKYYSIPASIRPVLQPTVGELVMGDGGTVAPLGVIEAELQVGSKMTVQHSLVVAEIQVPVVLGYDFLLQHQGAVDVSRQRLILGDQHIPCQLESRLPSLFRISLTQTVSIPPRSEMIVKATVDNADTCVNNEMMYIETSPSLVEKSGVLVARSLVCPKEKQVPLRLMNTTNDTKVIYKKTLAAVGEKPDALFQKEDSDGQVDEEIPPYLEDLFQRSTVGLDAEQTLQVKAFLCKYKHVFSSSKEDIGRTHLVTHKINTGDAVPVKQQPYRQPQAKREETRRVIKKLLKANLIAPSSSPWASPVVLCKKKDGTWRFAIDMRRLNAVTVKDSYPLPRIDDSLDALRGKLGERWFSVMDLASGYWQVAMDPADAHKTTFTTFEGTYHFQVMPFGCCNAPATFSRLMEMVLAGLHWKTCLVYLDDIICFSDSFQGHLEALGTILDRLHAAGLKLQPKKCEYFQHRVHYLGHVISGSGIEVEPEKTRVIDQWPQPTNASEVRSFIGTASFYRRFIKDFAEIARPLHHLTRKDIPFIWDETCTLSFQRLKKALVTAPVLSYPASTGQYYLDTDASKHSISGILSQLQDGEERVIAYFSRVMTPEEQRYCVTRRELLAVIESLRHYHHYVYSAGVKIRTDHGSLRWILNFKHPEDQLARWIETLGIYKHEIIFRPGRYNSNADGLSRIPCGPCTPCQRKKVKDSATVGVKSRSCQTPDFMLGSHPGKMDQSQVGVEMPTASTDTPLGPNVSFSEPTAVETQKSQVRVIGMEPQAPDIRVFDGDRPLVRGITDEEMRTAQQSDPDIGDLLKLKEDQKPRLSDEDVATRSRAYKYYWRQWNRLVVKKGILYREWYEGDTIKLQLVVPRCHKVELLRGLHDPVCSGHFGVGRTVARVQDAYYWAGYQSDVRDWCQRCTPCQAYKRPGKQPRAPMKPTKVGRRLQRVAMDILGPLPTSDRTEYKYILLISDYLSRWVVAVPLRDIEASTIARAFIDHFVTVHGIPESLHTDRGSQFESRLFQEVCNILQIHKTRTTPYFPQSDGLVERYNATLEAMLAKCVADHQRDWDQYLQLAMWAYRSAQHQTTGQSPSMMMTGKEMTSPIDLVMGRPKEDVGAQGETTFAFQLREKLAEVHRLARDCISGSQEKQEQYYNRKKNLNQYKVDDLVWVRDTRRRKGRSPKLAMNWDGPYKVERVISDWLYQLKKGQGKSQVMHHNRLKPDMGTNPAIEHEAEDAEEATQELHALAAEEIASGELAEEIASEEGREDLIVQVEEEPALFTPSPTPTAVQRTRAGRAPRRPRYLQDYD